MPSHNAGNFANYEEVKCDYSASTYAPRLQEIGKVCQENKEADHSAAIYGAKIPSEQANK
jgi:hypothetical protein